MPNQYQISPDIIDQIYKSMSDIELSHGGTGIFWNDFAFLENNGFDVAVLELYIRNFIKKQGMISPLSPIDTDEIDRVITLSLRDLARKQAGLPPLSEKEKSSWEFKAPPSKVYQWSPSDKYDDPKNSSDLTSDEIQILVDYLENNNPTFIRYVKLVNDYNDSVTSSNSNHDQTNSKLVWGIWKGITISDAIVHIFGEAGPRPLGRAQFKIDSEIIRRAGEHQ